MGVRYYAPTLMRWTQQDFVEQPTDAFAADRYAYPADPINRGDPWACFRSTFRSKRVRSR